jgi:hypothetical protein
VSKVQAVSRVRVPDSAEELEQILERAERGDASTLPLLRELLQIPGGVEFLGGDLAQTAERSFIRAISADNLKFQAALTRKLEVMRAELAGPNPTPVERLLVERVVICWLQVQDADVRFAQNQDNRAMAQSDHLQRRMDRSHRRYLSAIRTLAVVRKLAVPVLQACATKSSVGPNVSHNDGNVQPRKAGKPERLKGSRNRIAFPVGRLRPASVSKN